MKAQYTVLMLLLWGCTTTSTGTPDAAPSPESATRQLSRAVHWSRNSAEHKALVLQTYRLAAERLRQLVEGKETGTWAVVTDADETVIDNSLYARELSLADRPSTNADWDAWVARRAAPPLPGAVEFLDLVHELGGRIAVVTNRIEAHCPDTRANLDAFDIPFDVVLCRGESRAKEPRWQQLEEGATATGLPPLEIVMWLGDNIDDFPDLDQSIRLQGALAFSGFGDRYFVFPNPVYGSWEENPQD